MQKQQEVMSRGFSGGQGLAAFLRAELLLHVYSLDKV